MKIKLPLRVMNTYDEYGKNYSIFDKSDSLVAVFYSKPTAKLFADCFEAIAVGGNTDPDPYLCRTDYVICDIDRDLAKRAAEAVEE